MYTTWCRWWCRIRIESTGFVPSRDDSDEATIVVILTKYMMRREGTNSKFRLDCDGYGQMMKINTLVMRS